MDARSTLVRPSPSALLWIALLLLTGIAVGALTPAISDAIVRAGQSITHPDITSDYLQAVLWATLLGGSILYWPIPSADKLPLLGLWAVKAGIALGPMLLYERAYPVLDAYWYFDVLVSGQWTPFQYGIGHGAENTAGLVVLISHLTGSSFHAIKIVFAMIGMLGVYAFYRGALIITGEKHNTRLLMLLMLFPSILFWSTILGKEPIALLGVGVFVYGLAAWHRRRSLWYLAVCMAGMLVAAMIRVWFAPIMLAPVAWLAIRDERSMSRRVFFGVLAVAALIGGIIQFQAAFKLESISDALKMANAVSRDWAVGGSAQEIGTEFTSVGSMMKFVPRGAFAALFRPLPGEVMNPFGLLAGFENLALLALVGFAALRTRRATLRDPIVQAGLLMIGLWAAAYSVVSYQNLGAAVRYKLQILPVLLGVLLYIAFKPVREHE